MAHCHMRQPVPLSFSSPADFVDGVHSVGCTHCNNGVYVKHQRMLSEVESFCVSELGGSSCSRAGITCHHSDSGMVDTVLDWPSGASKRAGIDATCINALAPSHVSSRSALDADAPLRAAVAEKERRHRQ